MKISECPIEECWMKGLSHDMECAPCKTYYKCILEGKVREEEIKIKYFDGAEELVEFTNGDWIDLRANETVEMKEGDFHMIPLGVAMELPNGYEALVAPRSSTFKNYGILLVNSIGIIDESYCGNDDQWMFPAYATRDTRIERGERIAQFRIIQHQPTIRFNKVKELNNSNRGGFGSTGKK